MTEVLTEAPNKFRIRILAQSKFLGDYSFLRILAPAGNLIFQLKGNEIQLLCAKTLKLLKVSRFDRPPLIDLCVLTKQLIATVNKSNQIQIRSLPTLNEVTNIHMDEKCKIGVRRKGSEVYLLAIELQKIYIYIFKLRNEDAVESAESSGYLISIERIIDFKTDRLRTNLHCRISGNECIFAEEHKVRILDLESSSWKKASPNVKELTPGKDWYDLTEVGALGENKVVYVTYNGIIGAYTVENKQHEIVNDQCEGMLVAGATIVSKNGRECMLIVLANGKSEIVSLNLQSKLESSLMNFELGFSPTCVTTINNSVLVGGEGRLAVLGVEIC